MMKKTVTLIIIILLIIVLRINAKSKSFSLNLDQYDFSNNLKTSNIKKELNDDYNIAYEASDTSEFDKKYNDMGIQITYLLIGKPGQNNQNDYQDFKSRKDKLVKNYRYNPVIPKDEKGEYIKESQEYKDDILSGINIPGMFNMLNDMNIEYRQMGTPKVFKISDEYISISILLSNVKIDVKNKLDPMKIDRISTNLVFNYLLKKLSDEYKLYYTIVDLQDDIDEYYSQIIEKEKNSADQGLTINNYILESYKKVYDYSKLEKLSQETIRSIYSNHYQEVVILNTYGNEFGVLSSANGFFLSEGVVVTNYDYVESSLIKGHSIIAIDANGKAYNVTGVISIEPGLNIAVLKLDKATGKEVILGNIEKLEEYDPIIMIGSKTGYKLTMNVGIHISYSKDSNYIQNALPVLSSDAGSPLYNVNGEVVAVNTSIATETAHSIARSTLYLKDLQKKLKATEFSKIEIIDFQDIKEKFFLIEENDEKVINKLPSHIKKIGNIDQSIILPIISVNTYQNITSIRYKNRVSGLIANMNFIADFKTNLLKDKYLEKLNGTSKKIYENDKNKITIISKLDYLIVIVEKK